MSDDSTKTAAGAPRPDLQTALDAKAVTLDAARPEAVAKRHDKGKRTARENVASLVDPGSFQEFGQLAKPAFKKIVGPADGLVIGFGTMDGHRVAVAAYDFTVLGGSQATISHAKFDRVAHVIRDLRLPFVIFAEGAGWRAHEDYINPRFFEESFVLLARLSGLVPTVSIVAGRCFAGTANMAGQCDTVIATRDAAMGMAGPPLVEAGLGLKLTPEELGAAEIHEKSGTVDIVVETEDEAAQIARRYLSYFRGQGAGEAWTGEAPDTMALRDVVPENRRRAYDVRKVLLGIADIGSIIELRPRFAKAAVTALIKVEGRPVGVIANQPSYLSGAMDSVACDKIARFIQLCDAHDIPILFLCDTPGLMIGPQVEAEALARHSARVLTAAANATTPFMTVVLRKAYGLGFYMMGSLALGPKLLIGWPTTEFGNMGLEGAAKIVHRDELAALPDDKARDARIRELADENLRRNLAMEVAERFEIDDIIDPADTRAAVLRFLAVLPPQAPRNERKRLIDNW